MNEFGSGAIQLELKYCERCGTLWLRPKESDLVFCASCAVVMSGLRTSFRSLVPVYSEARHSGNIQSAFWSEGGNA
jgi:hypothetical protein